MTDQNNQSSAAIVRLFRALTDAGVTPEEAIELAEPVQETINNLLGLEPALDGKSDG